MRADPSAAGMGDQAKGRVCGRFAWPACLVALALAACGPRSDPLELARTATGRAATADLPPVPGAGQPYPSLGTVPERPVPPPATLRRQISDALVADRENARHSGPPMTPAEVIASGRPVVEATALEAPPATPLEPTPVGTDMPGIVAPDSPAPAPAVSPIAGAPTPRPAGTATVSAPASPVATEPAPSLPMAAEPPPPAMPEETRAAAMPAPLPQAPPPAAVPPAAVPAAPPAPLPREPAAAPPPPPVLAPAPSAPPAATPPVSAPAPAPAPPRPDPSVTVDRSALPPSRPAPRVTPLPAGQGAALAFPRGSATLPTETQAVVARFAAARGAATIRVTGYRDGEGEDLGLPLARAQAVAQALRRAGTPAEAIELAAEPRPGPAGRGAEMRLVYSP